MNVQIQTDQEKGRSKPNNYRNQLLAGLPVTEQHFNFAGISTRLLDGGEGPPIILLHGPGESSLWWMRVIPKLITTHRVIVPDLPGQGESKVSSDSLDTDLVFKWLSELIKS